MKTRTFPERVEKHGVCATIYELKHEAKGYTVAYHVRGKLVRKVRNSYEDAKQLAQSVVEQKGNGELDILTLGNRDCYVYLRAAEAVKASRSLFSNTAGVHRQADNQVCSVGLGG